MSDSRRCPHCGKNTPAKATKCEHCGGFLGLSEMQKGIFTTLVSKVKPEDEEKVHSKFEATSQAAKGKIDDPEFWEGIKTLWSMLKDPDYTITWETKAWIIFALGYFISPVDLIPDPIPGVGYLDDIAVVLWVLHKLHDEVVDYRKFKGVAK